MQVTRLGLYGGARGLYGSFAGKVEAAVAAVFTAPASARFADMLTALVSFEGSAAANVRFTPSVTVKGKF